MNNKLVRMCFDQVEGLDHVEPIEFNKNGFRFWERLSDSYLEYQKVLREIMVFLDYPKIIVSIHTHNEREIWDPDQKVVLYRPYYEYTGEKQTCATLLRKQLANELVKGQVLTYLDDNDKIERGKIDVREIMAMVPKPRGIDINLNGSHTLDSLLGFTNDSLKD